MRNLRRYALRNDGACLTILDVTICMRYHPDLITIVYRFLYTTDCIIFRKKELSRVICALRESHMLSDNRLDAYAYRCICRWEGGKLRHIKY